MGMTLDSIHEELDAIRRAGRWRALRCAPEDAALDLSSNDYLALARDPRVIAGAQAAVARYGCGARASRLMSGHTPLHAELEDRIAALVRQPRALVFPTGFQTNLGVIAALAGPGDLVLSDALNHASIVDACRLSRATVRIYRHGDAAHARALLDEAGPARRRIVATDAVFSMDGDLAPLTALRAAADAHGALLIVDEAHGIGVFGEGGGVCAGQGVAADVVVGTLSKALGSGGGFAAASAPVIDLLINKARSFIYTTGLAPACAGAALAALDAIAADPGMGRRLLARAQAFASQLREAGLDVPGTASPVVPVMIGGNDAAVATAGALRARGLWVTAIRPPTVPPGGARLRLSVTLAHAPAQLESAAAAIADALHGLGIEPAAACGARAGHEEQ